MARRPGVIDRHPPASASCSVALAPLVRADAYALAADFSRLDIGAQGGIAGNGDGCRRPAGQRFQQDHSQRVDVGLMRSSVDARSRLGPVNGPE